MKLNFNELRYYHWIVLFILSAFMSAYLLRQNNLNMIKIRDEVVAIDESSKGDIKHIEPVLQDLSNFVNSHMNTTMVTPVVLVSRYNVLFTQQVEKQQATATTYRQNVYKKAQQKCEISSIPLTARAECIQREVSKQPGVEQINPPPVEQFSYEFISPIWSPDLAGFSVLITTLLGLAAGLTLLLEFALPMLSRSFKNDPLE